MPLRVVVLFAGPAKDERRSVASTCEQRGWSLTEFGTVSVSSGRGRRLNMLRRSDAANLYVSCHRFLTGVVVLGKIHVRTDPRWSQLRDDRVINVVDFCRYKALVLRRNNSGELPPNWADDLQTWSEESHCEDHRDSRCFPFFSFDAGPLPPDLDTVKERSRFGEVYGRHPMRMDRRKRKWQSAGSGQRHGRDPVSVAGTLLADGFHWDVQASAGNSEILRPDAVFRLLSNGYANVYPDGVVREGKRSPRIWTPEQSTKLDRGG